MVSVFAAAADKPDATGYVLLGMIGGLLCWLVAVFLFGVALSRYARRVYARDRAAEAAEKKRRAAPPPPNPETDP